MGFQVENGNTADDHGRKKDPAEDQPSQEQPDMTKVSSPERIAPGTLRLAICDETKMTKCIISKEWEVLTSAAG